MPRRAFLLTALLVATACSSVAPGNKPLPDPLIWDVRSARFVTEDEVVAGLAGARYRLLGEIHDNPAHHAIRARLIAALAARGLRPAIVMEQFDLEHDDALQAAQTAGGDAEALGAAGQLDRRGWQWPMHKPILEAAIAAGLPVRAANLSREQLRGDVQSLAERTDAPWYGRFRAARWSDAQAAELRADIAASHCGKIPEAMVPRLVLAQRLRDAAMAQRLVDSATTDGAVLIAGDGHVRADLGVPVYLHAPGAPDAGARSISVGFVEATPEELRGADVQRRLAAENPGFDYVWVTPPASREDPCAGM
jgi:uncharacterized iron-regulated protein